MSQDLLARARAAIAQHDPTAIVEFDNGRLKVDSVLAAPALVGILRTHSILTQDLGERRPGDCGGHCRCD
jgi:hypothetical protein